ncbi:conjugal transfer protein TraN [Rickettsiaceae bacterium]|nr:conjugal transfer protein TraN [Rickettsiaceae bacterium]
MNLRISHLLKPALATMLLCFVANGTVIASVSEGFAKRENYKNATRLGNPTKYENFLKKDEDTTHLQSLSDDGLFNGGTESLRNSDKGKFLQKAEEKKIDAKEQYQINSNNQYLKDSIDICADPMSKTGGGSLSSNESHESAPVKKKCLDGVEFEVDIGRELVLESHEEEYLSEQKSEPRTIRLKGSMLHNEKMNWGYAIRWKEGRWGWHVTPYQVNVGEELQRDSPWKDNPELIIADARRYIAENVEQTEIDHIGEDVRFPGSGRGIGDIQWGYPRWRVVWDEYEFGYDFKWQDTMHKMVEDDEYWQVATEDMEKLVESHQCYEADRVCVKSGVKQFHDKYDITRPCWYEKVTFKCSSEPRDGCLHLTRKGCQLKNSICMEQLGSICLKWEREYLCGGKKKRLNYSLADSSIYCLGGNCHTPVIEENKDLANVAYLAATKEAHKDCTKEPNGSCKNPITVFPGESDSCKKIILSIIDCCSSMKGWGKNANLCQCSGEEKGLALKRDRGLCHQVGTYCSSRDPVFGKCLEKKTSFCCFSSKLARIFHQEGRKQLGISWGSAEAPDCRPLTLDELKRTDFTKFDMEELFDDLLAKVKPNKQMPTLAYNQVPQAQKDHMEINTREKRETKKRLKEEEERLRAEELERKKREQIRLAEIQRQARLVEEQRQRTLAAQRLAAQRQVEARAREEARIVGIFAGNSIYDTQKMLQDINNLPCVDQGSGMSWHPAAHFLRNNCNSFPLHGTGATKNLSGGNSNKYGAIPSHILNSFFDNPANYPAGYIATHGKYRPPIISLRTLRDYHGF